MFTHKSGAITAVQVVHYQGIYIYSAVLYNRYIYIYTVCNAMLLYCNVLHCMYFASYGMHVRTNILLFRVHGVTNRGGLTIQDEQMKAKNGWMDR